MAWLSRRGSVYYIKFWHSGSDSTRRIATGTSSFQIVKEKLRQFEGALARGDDSSLPTRTSIPAALTAYVGHIRTVKTAKSAQTDIYYPREEFGPVCDAVNVISRKLSLKAKKRPPKPGQDRRRKAPLIIADFFEQITTAQIAAFVSGQMASRGLAPKTANRYREILTRLFNWSMTQNGIRMPGDKERAPEIRFLTLKQIDEQLDALAKNFQIQTMVAMLIYAGLRREELLWLSGASSPFNRGELRNPEARANFFRIHHPYSNRL
jgi:hypothetical protein